MVNNYMIFNFLLKEESLLLAIFRGKRKERERERKREKEGERGRKREKEGDRGRKREKEQAIILINILGMVRDSN